MSENFKQVGDKSLADMNQDNQLKFGQPAAEVGDGLLGMEREEKSIKRLQEDVRHPPEGGTEIARGGQVVVSHDVHLPRKANRTWRKTAWDEEPIRDGGATNVAEDGKKVPEKNENEKRSASERMMSPYAPVAKNTKLENLKPRP
jgi:hypothetical protein